LEQVEKEIVEAKTTKKKMYKIRKRNGMVMKDNVMTYLLF
jgi:hypothetical protein